MVWPGLLGYVFPIHCINAFVTFQVLNLLPDDLVLLLCYVHSHVREVLITVGRTISSLC